MCFSSESEFSDSRGHFPDSAGDGSLCMQNTLVYLRHLHHVPYTLSALLRRQELRAVCVPGGTHSSSCVQTAAQNPTGSFLYILRTWRWKILAALPGRFSASPRAWANPAISLGNFCSKKLLPSHGAPETAQCDPQGLLSLRGPSWRSSWKGPSRAEF